MQPYRQPPFHALLRARHNLYRCIRASPIFKGVDQSRSMKKSTCEAYLRKIRWLVETRIQLFLTSWEGKYRLRHESLRTVRSLERRLLWCYLGNLNLKKTSRSMGKSHWLVRLALALRSSAKNCPIFRRIIVTPSVQARTWTNIEIRLKVCTISSQAFWRQRTWSRKLMKMQFPSASKSLWP